MIEIDWSIVSLLEAHNILATQDEAYIDGDKRKIIVKR